MAETNLKPEGLEEKLIEAAPFTPEATIGPFYPGVFVAQMPKDISLVAPVLAHRPEGRPITLSGRFFDSLGRPVPSLIIEFWQANAHGKCARG